MKKLLYGLVGTSAAVLVLAGGFAAGRLSDSTIAAVAPASEKHSTATTQAVVREYLLNNPEILTEMQSVLAVRDQEAQQLRQAAILKAEYASLFESEIDGVVGNPNGTQTIVEFFDFNCGYCKSALGDMQALVKANPNLRFVMKEFPILGPESQQAHMVSAAVRRVAPEQYADFHLRLMSGRGRADEAVALNIAKDLGLDEATLREKMRDPSIIDEFSKTYELANKLSITGTPSYVLVDEVVSGAVGAEALAAKLAAPSASN